VKTFCIILAGWILSAASHVCFAGEVRNPIADYAKFVGLPPGRVVNKWEVDLSQRKQQAILLDTKETSDEIIEEEAETKERHNPDIRTFAVYLPGPKGSGYVRPKFLDEGGALALVCR
jgi:hypothetical protein